MAELQYIPMKSARGEIAGYALVKDGAIEVRPKMRLSGSALVLSEDGSRMGRLNARLTLTAPLLAVAVVDGAEIACIGTPRGKPVPHAALARIAAAAAESPQPQVQEKSVYQAEIHPPLDNIMQKPSDNSPPTLPCTTLLRRPRRLSSAAPVMAEQPTQEPPAAATAPPDIQQEAQIAPQKRATTAPRPAWDDDASLAAITRRAEEAFARMEKRSREAKAAIAAKPLPQTGAPGEPLQMGADAPEAQEDGIEAILRALQNRQEEPAPLPRVPGSARHAEEKEEAPAAGSAPADAIWHAFFTEEKRDPPVFSAPPLPDKAPVPNPFPHIFPNASFIRVQDDPLPHLFGTWQRGGEQFTITAVPGSYSPSPPQHLAAFTRFIRARSGGYWVKVQEKTENDA